ncbi:SH3 domain-containing protein [Gluconacetobacter diazotrophicus]|uniref:SH3b domain-containing protein n=2 Tax=Gluconacetobacter diazotrophicus TaxID=33996 RepID=A9H4U6_GLUDA|nr:SH3 domain-containing protein [Gluconacetobacter diazotrophicus]MBB2156774.1 SH3 domain-containing protein [Gluconacetobacter diazotrophicus]CAP57487.1 conserved hypothetical protein [Gluconacetobacter diazotrophicus PA1 5]
MTKGRKVSRVLLIPAALALTIGVAVPALAAPGVVVGGTDIFAGPSPAYPVVGSLPPGTPVEIFGCESGWGWCDVAEGPYRGWVPAGQVQVVYNGVAGPLSQYGPMVGLPLVGFAFGNYWGAHYRNRPWFATQDRWGGGGRRPGFVGPVRGPGGGGIGRPEGGPGNRGGGGRSWQGGPRGGEMRGGGIPGGQHGAPGGGAPRGGPPHAPGGGGRGGAPGGGHGGGGHEGGHGGGHDNHRG